MAWEQLVEGDCGWLSFLSVSHSVAVVNRSRGPTVPPVRTLRHRACRMGPSAWRTAERSQLLVAMDPTAG